MTSLLDGVAVVLFEPQDPINIGTCVRAMKNMGLTDLRLVNPRDFDRERAAISAPHGEDVIASARVFGSLEEALADRTLVAATSARGRAARQEVARPREAAPHLLEHVSGGGRVALLFGREDRGLTNAELDQAHLLLTIPTRPDYASLNLGQAVLVITYELFLLGGAPEGFRTPKRSFAPATGEQLEGLYAQLQTTLRRVEFLKPPADEGVMRALRGVFQRAALDQREASILRGAFVEVIKYMERRGLKDHSA